MKVISTFDKINKNKLRVFNAFPYPAQIIVYDISDDEGVRKAFPDHPEVADSTLAKCCIFHDEGCNIITMGFRDSDDDIAATIAHECYHAMNYCYSLFGVNHDAENDEAGAYFLGYLVREVTRRIEDMK